MRAALVCLLAAAVALPGCGGGDDTTEPGGGGASVPPSMPAGPVLSIEEALASEEDGAVAVSGNLLVTDGAVRLCSALAESFPPQCGGPSLLVEGLDYAELDGVVTTEGVTWSDRPIEVHGVVADETLTVVDDE